MLQLPAQWPRNGWLLPALLLVRAAVPTGTRQPGAATPAMLAHATQKILATDPPPAGAPLHLTAARNEYEPLLVVLKGAQTVSTVAGTVVVGGKDLPTAVYRVG